MTTQLPTLPEMVDGIVERDLLGWAVQCRECGRIGRGATVLLAILDGDIRFLAALLDMQQAMTVNELNQETLL